MGFADIILLPGMQTGAIGIMLVIRTTSDLSTPSTVLLTYAMVFITVYHNKMSSPLCWQRGERYLAAPAATFLFDSALARRKEQGRTKYVTREVI